MKYINSLISLILMLGIASCSERHSAAIDTAYSMLDSNPDSALTILGKVNQQKLHKSERARYALIYTIAQDKSGLDVDDDSLLSVAYSYYCNKEEDTLFAKCQYYMGQYYKFNAKLEQATVCFEKSLAASELFDDSTTTCLALDRLANIHRKTEPEKAIAEARKALKIYSTLRNISEVNLFYYKLSLSETLLMGDSLESANIVCKEAITQAKEMNNSHLLSIAYQDMAEIFRAKGDYAAALNHSLLAYNMSERIDASKKLGLALSYLEADKLEECKQLIDSIIVIGHEQAYTLYYIRNILAIKEHLYNEACLYADSAYSNIENMYTDELAGKEQYYTALVASNYDKAKMEGRIGLQRIFMAMTVVFSLIVISLLLFAYRQYKAKVSLRMQKDAELHQSEKIMHEQELRFRETQMSTMRKYILKKITITQKIEEIRGNTDKHSSLSEEDWEEIKIFVENTEDGFVTRLKERFSELSEEDLRFMILIRLKLSAKAMASVYAISEKSIRQKLFVYKNKVGIGNEKSISLRDFVKSF